MTFVKTHSAKHIPHSTAKLKFVNSVDNSMLYNSVVA